MRGMHQLPTTAERNGDAPAIEAEGLVRDFGGRVAVSGVDLRLERGGFLAVLGPSGSGKTTLSSSLARRRMRAVSIELG